jgi:hypothetical protein
MLLAGYWEEADGIVIDHRSQHERVVGVQRTQSIWRDALATDAVASRLT